MVHEVAESFLTLVQTEWHAVSGAKFGSQIIYNIFSETNPEEHARIKKPIAKYFSASGVASMEPHVDKAVALFAKQLGTRFAGKDNKMGQPFNFGDWCMFCKSRLLLTRTSLEH